MKIGIYSPHFDELTGGEQYLLTFAEYCLQRGFIVELFWHDFELVKQAEEQFSLKLTQVKLNPDLYYSFLKDASYLRRAQKWWELGRYDCVFALTEKEVPFLNAKQNWLYFHDPVQCNGKGFWSRQRLANVHRVVCNSHFTKHFVDTSLGIHSDVIYPPVPIHWCRPSSDKKHLIVAVGSLDDHATKRQDVLITAFKQLCDQGLRDWQLVLAGRCQNEEVLLALREQGLEYPIDFAVNPPYDKLISLFTDATIFWHSAGFEIDPQHNPEMVEPFGVSIVEAMAAGCIALVYKNGAVTEIIEDKQNGYLWTSVEQLVHITHNTIESQDKEKHISQKAQVDARKFSKEVFYKQIEKFFV